LLAYMPAINVQLGEYYLDTTLTHSFPSSFLSSFRPYSCPGHIRSSGAI
jgi:hypothetical protein